MLVGFLMNGNPAMAKVITKPGEDSLAYFYAPTQPGDFISMVGQTDAKEQILAAIGLNYSLRQLQWAGAAAGRIWYLCQHQGEKKIGGGVALAVCPIDGPMYWPTVSVGGRLFLRGVDITECAEPDARTVRVALHSWRGTSLPIETFHPLGQVLWQSPSPGVWHPYVSGRGDIGIRFMPDNTVAYVTLLDSSPI